MKKSSKKGGTGSEYDDDDGVETYYKKQIKAIDLFESERKILELEEALYHDIT